MEKMNLDLPKVERDESLGEQLLGNPYVQKQMQQQNIPASEVKNSAYTIHHVLKQRSACQGCSGLYECRQKPKGQRLCLTYDVFLTSDIETCPYQTEYENEHAHMEHFLLNDMGEKLSTVSFEKIDLRAKENTGAVYSSVLAQCYEACMNGKSLYLYGPMGTGKTYLAACCANQMARNGKKVCFVHAPAFFNKVMDLLQSGEYHKMEQRCRYCDLLVLDDLGAEEVTDKTRSVLLAILDDRMQNDKMTWITSNADYKALENHYLYTGRGENRLQAGRILERIRTACTCISLTGKDRRILSLQDK